MKILNQSSLNSKGVGVLNQILFIGKSPKSFQFVQQVLDRSLFNLKFIPFVEFNSDPQNLENIRLIILDAIPLSNDDLHLVYSLKRESTYPQIPILALIEARPARLRYRMVEMGVDDYLTVPFDKLDLQVKVKNLINVAHRRAQVETNNGASVEIISSINQLLKKSNQPRIESDSKSLINDILLKLKVLLNCHSVLLFELKNENLLSLKSIIPPDILDNKLELSILEFPLFEKAVGFKEPIFLNIPKFENPFISYLNSKFKIQISAISIYPLILSKGKNFVIVILKTNQEIFTNDHFLMIEVFVELIRFNTHLLDSERQEEGKIEQQQGSFFYDFLDKVVNQLGFGILAIDKQNQIKFINEEAAQIFGVSKQDVLYKPLTNLLTPKDVEAILSFKDNVNGFERPELKIDVGANEKILLGFSLYRFADEETAENGLIISLKDITLRKEIEDERNTIEHLNSLGLMTTGIAHEIRNPLTGIKAIAQTLQDELDDHDSRTEHLSRIIRLVNRLDDLLKSLYAYARPQIPMRDFHSIENIFGDVTTSLQDKLTGKNIQIIETFPSDLPDIYVDRDQMEKVLSNILTNSIEAIESDGEIKISVHSLENGYPVSKEHFKALTQGKLYVEIHIHDNGSGILQSNLRNIFNPFFTTKILSAGLGLSVVYQTIKQNGGLIYFESEEKKGTDCYLILPAYK